MPDTRFHLAFPVKNLSTTKKFYCDILGCRLGRESDHWVDFDFFDHQLSAHLSQAQPSLETRVETSEVDGIEVPLQHFGLILPMAQWHTLVESLKHHRVDFLIAPTTRYPGQTGEQKTCFILDPSGNGLEFKAFANPEHIYQRPL